MVEIVHITGDHFKIKIFLKFITILALWRHLVPQKRTLGHYQRIFVDFRLFDHYNIEIILWNHGGDCSNYSGDYFEIKLFQKFITILALWRHFDPKNALFEHFEQFFEDFRLFDQYNIEIIL
jgi:hypothetical protein